MYNKYEIEKNKRFPFILFDFNSYDGAKSFFAILFLLEIFYFLFGLNSIFVWENKWWRPDSAFKFIYFVYHSLIFTVVYCLTWVVFDKKGIEGYVLSLFGTVIGIIYIISPVDIIPEGIPGLGLVGTLDDLIFGVGAILMGVYAFINNKNKNRNTEEIINLIQSGNHNLVIENFLKSEGYKYRKQ